MNRESSSVALFPALRWFSQASLVALAAALPFELVKPVAPLGPLKLSSVELFLYATVGAWLAARCAAWLAARGGGSIRQWLRSRRVWRGLSETHRAAALWALVLLLAALAAPIERASALKFALRSLGGVVLFAAAADLLDSPRAIRRTVTALGVGALAAALLMALELALAGEFALLLRPFHAQTFGILGLMRASGPFQYPNIGAMYLEASLPVLVAAGVGAHGSAEGSRPNARAIAATGFAGLIVIYAIVLAASRAGLITTLLALFGLAALARDLPALRRLSIALAAGLVVVTLVAQSLSPLLALRLRVWQEGSWYASVIEPTPDHDEPPSPLPLGGQLRVALSIRNIGALTWPAGGGKPVKLSYHWMNEDGDKVVQLDGARTDLPHDIVPGERFDIEAILKTPARAGNYSLWWDLVHEKITWFSDTADLGLWQSMTVGAPEETPQGNKRTTRMVLTRNSFDEFSRLALWRAGWLAFRDHPLFGIGPDNFRHAYGFYLGRKGVDERLHANNFYVEILATMGIFGVLALGVLMIALARTARRAVTGAGAGQPMRVLAFGVAVGLAAYFVHGTLDYFLGFTPTYALFWLLAGTLVALERIAARAPDARADPRLSEGWPR